MSSKIRTFIEDSSFNNQKNAKEFKIFLDIPVYIKDPLPENINILNVLSEVEDKVPAFLTNRI